MKKLLLLLSFIISGHFLAAQHNEVQFSTKTSYKNVLENGVSMSFFRNLNARYALGARFTYQSTNYNNYYTRNIETTYFDLSNRWNLSRHDRFRLLAEVGTSVKREERVEFLHDPIFCGVGLPIDSRVGFGSTEYHNISIMGFGRLGVDYRLFKQFRLGFGYDLRVNVFRNYDQYYDENNHESQSYINISYTF